MKLLLDEMHTPAVATALVRAGIEALAVASSLEFRGSTDEDLLRYAAGAGYAIVTENVRDFAVLNAAWTASKQTHAGLIFTNRKRFNRALASYPGSLISALVSFANSASQPVDSWVWWLRQMADRGK